MLHMGWNTMTNEYNTLPWWIKWSFNWYFIAGMCVLTVFNVVTELSIQHPDEISTGWVVTHTLCGIWWVYQGNKRRRMDNEARRIVM